MSKLGANVPKRKNPKEKKLHPWRMCPIGQHWVSDHPLKVPISEKNPAGMTIRDGHCHGNPSKKTLSNSCPKYLSASKVKSKTEKLSVSPCFVIKLQT